MKRALANVAIGKVATRLFQVTYPRMEQYAKEIGATHVIQTRSPQSPKHFAKFDVLRRCYAAGFEQILFLDIDIYIKPESPNIFDHYSAAAFSEVPHPNPRALLQSISWIRTNLDRMWPAYRYFNTGVLVLDRDTVKQILDIFDKMGPKPGVFYEQDQLNYIMHQVGFPKQRLDRKWNQGLLKHWREPDAIEAAYFLHANGVRYKAKEIKRLKRHYE